jgi:hypothetical protein
LFGISIESVVVDFTCRCADNVAEHHVAREAKGKDHEVEAGGRVPRNQYNQGKNSRANIFQWQITTLL